MHNSPNKFMIGLFLLSLTVAQACAPQAGTHAQLHDESLIETISVTVADLPALEYKKTSPFIVDARPAPSESALMQMAMNDTPVQEYEDDFATSDVSDAELDETRGTFSPDMLNKNVLDAISNGNSSVNTVSGANTVSAEAFSNTSGLVNLIQNSGNNVIIQSSTIVNLTLQ